MHRHGRMPNYHCHATLYIQRCRGTLTSNQPIVIMYFFMFCGLYDRDPGFCLLSLREPLLVLFDDLQALDLPFLPILHGIIKILVTRDTKDAAILQLFGKCCRTKKIKSTTGRVREIKVERTVATFPSKHVRMI